VKGLQQSNKLDIVLRRIQAFKKRTTTNVLNKKQKKTLKWHTKVWHLKHLKVCWLGCDANLL
jgi:hypothetical protein